MLPCDYITVSFVSIHFPDQELYLPASPGPNRHHSLGTSRCVRVQHFNKNTKCSYILLSFAREFCLAQFGPAASNFVITSSCRVYLRWHYPDLPYSIVTEHQPLPDLPVPVVLARQDWIGPLSHLWATQKMSHQRAGRQAEKQHYSAQSSSDNGSQSSAAPSRSCSPVSCSDGGQGWGGMDLVDLKLSDPEVVDAGSVQDAQSGAEDGQFFWKWSEKKDYWYHLEDDGSETPFPLGR